MKRLRVPAQYLPIFCRELHQLVRTGIPLAEGLTMLREDETDPDTRSWLEALCRSTEEGLPLASALRETGAFPAYMTDMVSLAEETGRLEDVLLSLQRHYDRQLRMAADIRGAVAVPVTLFAVMVAVVILLVTQVLPVFDRVFAQLGVRMGAVATGMMNAGAVLAKAGTGIAVVLVAAAAGPRPAGEVRRRVPPVLRRPGHPGPDGGGAVRLLHVHGGCQRTEHGGIRGPVRQALRRREGD